MKKAMKKVIAFALAAFVLFSTVPSFAATSISDQAKLDKLEELNVIKGEGHGIDGTKTMTRYRSIVMLLRLLGLEDEMLAFDYEGKDTFADAEGQNGYQQRLMAYVKATPELNIVGYPDGTFRPYREVNSQEYAKILLKALSYADPEDYTWETVAAKAEEIGLVDSASDINLTDEFIVFNLAALTYDSLTLVSKGDNVTLGEKLGYPIVTTLLDINSVSSLNSTTQDVSLNQDISIAPSTDVFTLVDEDNETFEVLSTSLRANNTMVRLTTAPLKENALYTLTYNGVSYKFVAKAADTEKPELQSAVALTNTTVKLNFNEEVDVNALITSNYEINDVNVLKAAYDVDADENPIKTVVILTTSSQTQGTIYEVEVSNVTDLSGNVIDSDNDSFQFGGLAKDETKPELQSAVALSNTSVKLTFNEDMDEASVENIANYEIEGINILKAERQTAKNEVILTTTAQTSGTIHKVVVSNVKDVSGNVINSDNDEFLFAGLAPDTTSPRLTSAVSLTNTSVKLTFNEDVEKVTAENIANYEVEGLVITKAERQTAENEVVLTTSEHEAGKLYKVNVTNVTDLSNNEIDSDHDEYLFAGLAKDTTAPRVSGAVSIDNKTVKVTFNEPMDEITAKLPYNYYFGSELGYPTKVVKDTVVTDGTVWVLTTGAQSSKIYTVDVTGVNDLSGNVVDEDHDTAEFAGIGSADGTAPKLSSAVATNNNTVVVKFNEEIDKDTVQPVDFTFTVESGTETSSNKIADAANPTQAAVADDNKTVTLQFETATMTSGVIYKVTAADINDSTGNTIITGTNDSALFAGTTVANDAPRVTSAVLFNNQTLKITFSEALTITGDLDNSDFSIEPSDSDVEFTGTVNKVVVSSDKKSVTVYYTGDTFESGKLYTVTVAADKIKDSLGIDSLDTTDNKNEAVFGGINSDVTSPKISGVIAVDENTIDIIFDQVIESSLSSSNTDDIIIKYNNEVVSATDALVREEGTEGNKLRVFFSGTPFDSSKVYDIELEDSKIVNKNGTVMSSSDNSAKFATVTTENKDPELASAVALSKTQTKVTFSEIVAGVTVGDVSGEFTLSGLTVTKVEAGEDGKSFILTHEETETGDMITVSVSAGSITDEAGVGNVNTSETVKFVAK
ncbi:hypothetical protein [Vallitalea maricola]|uniref:Uncharacterized protein n=1 Tax=Vallitalea maricola TaxID=3074433 RepID=A0ACB5UD44_9FIRM|nr:hypothetical protein AN2V17_00850 [Vallitalea sp. AN17-2]